MGCSTHVGALAFKRAMLVGLTAALGCGTGPLEPAQLCTSEASRNCWEALGLDGHHVSAIAATPAGVFAGDFRDGVFRRDSASGVWEPLGLDHAIVSAITYVPGDTARVLVGVRPFDQEETEAAVFATEDAGRSWLPWDGGLAEENGRRFWAYSLTVDSGNPLRLFMGGDAEVLRSATGGRTWEFVHGKATSRALGVNSIAVSPRRDGNVWAGGQSAFDTGRLLHSDDWGDSWKVFPVNVGTIYVVAIDPSAPDVLWAAAPGGVISSDDAGETWRVRLRGLVARGIAFLQRGAYVFGTALPEAETDVPVAFHGHLVGFWSPDRGNSWAPVPVQSDVYGAVCMTVDAQGRVLVGTSGSGVWRYTPH